MSKKFLSLINLTNLSSDPESGSEGDVYWNSESNKIRIYDGSAWSDLTSGGGGGSSNSFSTISVSGQSNVVADSSTDTLTIVAGTNVGITTNATTDSITINSTGAYTAIDSIVYPDFITLDTTPETTSTAVGTISWDVDNETIKAQLNNVSLQVGQEHIVRVKNNSGSVAIPDRTPVMFAGATGDTVKVSPADASDYKDYPSDYFVGITTEEIPADGFGFVTQFGFVNNVDTSTWEVGTLLYVDPATAGGLTSTHPAAPAWQTPIAAVTKQNGSAGRIFVRAIPGIPLDNTEGVSITSPLDNNILAYDSDSGLWKNQTAIEAGLIDTSSTEQTKTGNLIISGNLTVNGTTTTLNTENLLIEDNLITLNSGITGTPSLNAGIEVERGTSDNVSIIWDESVDRWKLTGDGTNFYSLAVQNGWTTTGSISITSSDDIDTGTISLNTYANSIHLNDSVGLLVNVGAGTKIFSFKNDGTFKMPDGTIQSTAFLGIGSYNTSQISENTNLYFTDERAQDSVATALTTNATHSGVSVSYNDGSNAINITNTGVTSVNSLTGAISATNLLDALKTVDGNGSGLDSDYLDGHDSSYFSESTHTHSYQPLDADLTAIAGISSTSGLLRKTAADTWSLDTNTYLTTAVTSLSGTANQITASASTGSVTLSLPSAVTMPGSLTVTGDLTVNGTTTTTNSTTVTIDDPVFTLGGDTAPSSDDNKDRGIEYRWHNGTSAKVGFFGYDDSASVFTFIPDATNSSEVFSGTPGIIRASAIDYNDGVSTALKTETFSSSGTVDSLADSSFSSNNYSAAEYTIYVKNASGKYTSKVMLICDGASTVNITEYAILTAGTAPTVNVSASNVSNQVQLTVGSSSATQIRIIRSLVAI